jgi:hypothetical protein
MNREQRLFKLMTAVRDCLQTCTVSGSPRQALSSYMQRLRNDPHWTDAEIQEVEQTAGMALAAEHQSNFKETDRGRKSYKQNPQREEARVDRHWT